MSTGVSFLGLEFYKSKRRKTLLITIAMTAVQCLWLMWAMRNLNADDLLQGYAACLYQFPLLNAIVLPVAISVLVLRVCDIEHKGNTLKQMLTMQPAGRLFDAKFLCAALHIVLAMVLQITAIYALGRVYGFGDALTAKTIALYLVGQTLCSLFLVLLIQMLALLYANPFVPLAAGLIAGFLGLMAMFFPQWVMRFVPSAYYGLLSTVIMDWDAQTRISTYYSTPFSVGDALLLAAAFAVLYCFGRFKFVRKEV